MLSWFKCYRTLAETPGFPQTVEELTAFFAAKPSIQTFGVVDKNRLLGIRHEAPLVGLLTFDQDTLVNGNFHIATTRKAWGSHLADNALQLLVGHLFDTHPTLTRVTGTILATNAPAKGLAKRVGFRYEGRLRDACTVGDVPVDMCLFGITRREWYDQGLGEVVIEPVARPQRYHDAKLEELIEASISPSRNQNPTAFENSPNEMSIQ